MTRKPGEGRRRKAESMPRRDAHTPANCCTAGRVAMSGVRTCWARCDGGRSAEITCRADSLPPDECVLNQTTLISPRFPWVAFSLPPASLSLPPSGSRVWVMIPFFLMIRHQSLLIARHYATKSRADTSPNPTSFSGSGYKD